MTTENTIAADMLTAGSYQKETPDALGSDAHYVARVRLNVAPSGTLNALCALLGTNAPAGMLTVYRRKRDEWVGLASIEGVEGNDIVCHTRKAAAKYALARLADALTRKIAADDNTPHTLERLEETIDDLRARRRKKGEDDLAAVRRDFPKTFALCNHGGHFRVSPWASYVNDSGVAQIVTQIYNAERDEWLDYARAGVEEFRRVAVEPVLEDEEDELPEEANAFPCERCGVDATENYYSADDCNTTGVDVVLCEPCCVKANDEHAAKLAAEEAAKVPAVKPRWRCTEDGIELVLDRPSKNYGGTITDRIASIRTEIRRSCAVKVGGYGDEIDVHGAHDEARALYVIDPDEVDADIRRRRKALRSVVEKLALAWLDGQRFAKAARDAVTEKKKTEQAARDAVAAAERKESVRLSAKACELIGLSGFCLDDEVSRAIIAKHEAPRADRTQALVEASRVLLRKAVQAHNGRAGFFTVQDEEIENLEKCVDALRRGSRYAD